MLYKDGQMLQAIRFGTSPLKLPAVEGDMVDVLFQLNINDYQGVKSLQLILQDIRISERFEQERRREDVRLGEVLEGAPIAPEERLVPDREEIAAVFTVLRSDARLGNMVVTERSLLDRVNRTPAAVIGRIKLRLILRILTEMGVCHVDHLPGGFFTFNVNFDAPKTSIDSSPLLRRLRNQLADGSV